MGDQILNPSIAHHSTQGNAQHYPCQALLRLCLEFLKLRDRQSGKAGDRF